jgi:hypothetical protein
MPGTWAYWSKQAVGYIATQTPKTERYVALYKIQHHIDQGYSDAQVALIWNQGNASPCKSGVNRHGVAYDSCKYQLMVLAYIQ